MYILLNCKLNVYVSEEKLQVVSDFKYLGVILDSNLSFKKQVKKVIQITKFNLANFRFIRNCLTTEVAKLTDNKKKKIKCKTVLQIYDTPSLNILLD